MNLRRIKASVNNRVQRYISEHRGWTTNRKIVVIESDDWGSIRMPSREVYEKSLRAGYRVDLNMFEKYDSLESEEDLIFLFETLTKFKDFNGNHPRITANSLVANPDFDKIKESRNTEYFFETVDKTFLSYPKHKRSMDLWYEGEGKGVFCLQYHGREHFNQFLFMKALNDKQEEALWALKYKMGGAISKNEDNKNKFVAASAFNTIDELEEGIKNIKEGIRLFKSIHNKESESYIGTNYIWPTEFELILKNEGIKYLQGTFAQRLPINKNIVKYKYHYTGQVNTLGQIYLVRNCLFEPSLNNKKDWVTTCQREIDTAFKNNKPAIISSHRVNFIGSIFPENRDNNLKLLELLINKIIKKWPNVEFMTSDQLGQLIQDSNNKNSGIYND